MKNMLTRSRAIYAENRGESLPDSQACKMMNEKDIRKLLREEVCRMYPNIFFFQTLLKSGNGTNYVDVTDDEGNTLLHKCAWFNHADITQILLDIPQAKDLINAMNEDDETALLIALEQEAFETANILIEAGANLHIGKSPPLISALKSNMEEIARMLVENQCDIHAIEKIERSSLIWAIEKKMIDFAIELIKRGVSIEDIDFNGDTPLTKACRQQGCERIVTALIEGGADIHKPNRYGKLPVSYAQPWILKRHPEFLNKKIELKNKYELIVNLLTNDMEEIWKSILNKQ